MHIPIRLIPATIMNKYNLAAKEHHSFVYVEICKGMHGLLHAGNIANDRLVQHLHLRGYQQAKHTHDLFTHNTRPGLIFSLSMPSVSNTRPKPMPNTWPQQ
jgi:hypothetical protein